MFWAMKKFMIRSMERKMASMYSAILTRMDRRTSGPPAKSRFREKVLAFLVVFFIYARPNP